MLPVLPTSQGRLRWALIPAGVLFVFGLFLVLTPLGLAGYADPAILILVGSRFIARTVISRSKAE